MGLESVWCVVHVPGKRRGEGRLSGMCIVTCMWYDACFRHNPGDVKGKCMDIWMLHGDGNVCMYGYRDTNATTQSVDVKGKM